MIVIKIGKRSMGVGNEQRFWWLFLYSQVNWYGTNTWVNMILLLISKMYLRYCLHAINKRVFWSLSCLRFGVLVIWFSNEY